MEHGDIVTEVWDLRGCCGVPVVGFYMREEEPGVGMVIMLEVLGAPKLLVLLVPSWRKEVSGCSIHVISACSGDWWDA